MDKKVIFGIGVFALAALIYFMFGKGSSVNGNAVAISTEIIDEGDMIKIPLSAISTKAQFQEYNSNGVDIEYFIVKAKDGSIKAAFNACDVCYRSKKGYRQQGSDMICNNCGNHYAISGLGTKNLNGGGCWPGYLPARQQGDYLIIEKNDIEQGKYRFA
ncbi:DUF2318 domain-containing protein [Candidatus Pacearchaeota archaeon]|nr:DUF2318 domain-containing protein [Candidatus Pacearchaeota archaeon]